MKNKDHKKILKTIWDMRHLTLEEALKKISGSPSLQFLLTSMGAWLLLRWVMAIWISVHVVYLVCRIFKMVLG